MCSPPGALSEDCRAHEVHGPLIIDPVRSHFRVLGSRFVFIFGSGSTMPVPCSRSERTSHRDGTLNTERNPEAEVRTPNRG